MIENEDGTFGLSEDEWAHERVMMEVAAAQDLRKIIEGNFDRTVAEAKFKSAIRLARSAAHGNAERLAWLTEFEGWFLGAIAKDGEARQADMQELLGIVQNSFRGWQVVETFELPGASETKH